MDVARSMGRTDADSNVTPTGGAVGFSTLTGVNGSLAVGGVRPPDAAGGKAGVAGPAEQCGPWHGGFAGAGSSAVAPSAVFKMTT
jgi:hypothetical protein